MHLTTHLLQHSAYSISSHLLSGQSQHENRLLPLHWDNGLLLVYRKKQTAAIVL